jgi:hypothetical protein
MPATPPMPGDMGSKSPSPCTRGTGRCGKARLRGWQCFFRTSLRNWGPATFRRGGFVSGHWVHEPAGAGVLNAWTGRNGVQGGHLRRGAHHVDRPSVRRDPGIAPFSFLLGGPSVQIEIEQLSGPGGTAASGVTLNAVEDGDLIRAVGPSLAYPVETASYTLTLYVGPIIP